MDTGPYLDYLDKEMTIMGVLSAFCAAILALVFKTGLEGTNALAQRLWQEAPRQITVALSGLIAATLLFYLQRSLLAWYYGQIAIAQVKGEEGLAEKLINEADGWDTWLRYQTAFIALTLAALCSLQMVIIDLMKPEVIGKLLLSPYLVLTPLVIIAGVRWLALSAQPQTDEPVRSWWLHLGRGRNKSVLP